MGDGKTPWGASEKEIDDAIKRRKEFDKKRAEVKGQYVKKLKEGAQKMERSYTQDELTVARLLKGNPKAQEIVDALFKSSKKTEGGEEFQDGSEDTIGGEGHASPGRPGTIKHEGGKPVPGPDHPGVAAKNASMNDPDLEKAEERGTLTDNEPEEFEEGIEEDDTIPAEKSYTQDELTLGYLFKSLGEERFELVAKAVLPKLSTPGALRDPKLTEEQKRKSGNPLVNRKANPEALRSLQQRLGTGGAEKSEEDFDLEKSESDPTYHETDKKQEDVQSGKAERERKAKARIEADKSQDDFDLEKAKKGTQEEERAEWAKDPEGERKEHGEKKEKSMEWSLEFSKSILQRMGLEDIEKGSPSVSKKVAGGKATQIRYGADKGEDEGKTGKPESRWSHPKSGEEKRYRFEPKKGEVTVRSRKKGEGGGEWKERKIGAGEQEKLKNASADTEGFDLHKALDDILEKKRQS